MLNYHELWHAFVRLCLKRIGLKKEHNAFTFEKSVTRVVTHVGTILPNLSNACLHPKLLFRLLALK